MSNNVFKVIHIQDLWAQKIQEKNLHHIFRNKYFFLLIYQVNKYHSSQNMMECKADFDLFVLDI